jgi:hypothetical protein
VEVLYSAIGRTENLSLTQAEHWYAMALEFKPDLIVELGRGVSTAVLAEAAHNIGAVVKSFDLERGWKYGTQVEALLPEQRQLEIITADITKVDFAPHVRDFSRVLVVWDCHGYAIADAVLGGLMPLIADKPHVVLCHDIADNRIVGKRDYRGPFWRGIADYYANRARQPRSVVNLGWACSYMDQVIPILDFCWRNGIELHSADYELKEAGLLEEPGEWVYFTLNESAHTTFPERARRRSAVDFTLDQMKSLARHVRALFY